MKLLVLLLPVMMSAATLTGSLNYPGGTGASGVLYFALSQQAALSAAGGCGGPIEVVPTYQVAVTITNGSIVGSPTLYGNDCLLPQGTYYVVQFKDNNGNVLLNDWWVVTGTTFNIGTVVSAIITGTTQTLGQPGVVLTAPTATQTIVQPSSTVMNVNYLGATGTAKFPDTSLCNTTNCTFDGAVSFLNGFANASTSSVSLYIGAAGALYLRSISGADLTCSGSAVNGFIALRLDTFTLEVCIGTHAYGVVMTRLN